MDSKQRTKPRSANSHSCRASGNPACDVAGALDQTVMAAALPTVADALRGLDQMPASITGYLVAASRPGRAGIGGGGLMIGTQAIIGELVRPRERGRFLGIIGTAYVVAAVVGPLAGGAVVDRLSWRWIFHGYVPVGLAALAVASLALHLPPPLRDWRIDYGGAALLNLAIVVIILLCSAGNYAKPPWLVPVLAVAAAASLAVWLLTARLAVDPILPLTLFRDAAFTIPTAISFLLGFDEQPLAGLVATLLLGLGIGLGAAACVRLRGDRARDRARDRVRVGSLAPGTGTAHHRAFRLPHGHSEPTPPSPRSPG